MANVYLKGWGCTANQDNEAILAGLLVENNHTLVMSLEDADIVILNTCTVKLKTEQKIMGFTEAIEKAYPEKKIIFSGCMAGAQAGELQKEHPRIALVSTQHITDINTVIDRLLDGEVVCLTSKRMESKLNLPKRERKDGIGIVQIGEGCVDVCWFCATKLAKGHIRSFPMADIVKQVQMYVQNGIKKVYLTSQDNGAYGLDYAPISQLANLLKALIIIESDFQIRVGMANPRHLLPILDDLLKVYQSQKIMKFLHIPVQAGSEKVLQEMNRKHSVKDFKILTDAFRRNVQEMNIATDIICGYPTETEEDFNETVRLLEEYKPEVVNIAKFTPRPGTKAALLKQLPSQEVKRRSTVITALYYNQINERKLTEEEKILVESVE